MGNLSLSWHYSVTWAVIYTLTNISATQVQIEVQAAIGISASIKISTCTNGTGTIPCQVTSFDVSVSGSESSNGYTNITNSTVDQTNASAGSPVACQSWAIMNSWSKAALNFSGSYAAHIPLSDVKSESVSASFDVGGSETSSISFASPLSLVPMDPAAGDLWNSSAAYRGPRLLLERLNVHLEQARHAPRDGVALVPRGDQPFGNPRAERD